MVFEHDYNKFPELTNRQINDFGLSSPHFQYTEDFVAKVIKVHDGDTVTLQTKERDFNFPLRLLNIDARELNEGGKEIGEWLRNRALGKTVDIRINSNNRVDRYGRLLGDLIVDGLNMGEVMLALNLVKTFEGRNDGIIPNSNEVFEIAT